jgi:glycosyltransferase involved in cell wall biosynthesis
MKILFLSQIVPYPPHGGVLQRGYNIIREISRDNDVYLMAFVHPDTLGTPELVEDSKLHLEQYCRSVDYFSLWPKKSSIHKYLAFASGFFYPRPFSTLAHRSVGFRRRMREIIEHNDVDVLHIDTIGLAPYYRPEDNIPTVMTHHNIESALMARRSKVESIWLARYYVALQSKRLRAYEIEQSPRFDMNVMVSATDENELKAMAPTVNTTVVPNGVDTEYFGVRDDTQELAVIYTGGMNMFANKDAVMHLIDDIWPRVKAQCPEAVFNIIGQDPPLELLNIARHDASIKVLGYVADIRPYVAGSAVYVVPLRVGGGTRLKVLDALSQGKAIVSTSVGCEGIEVTHGLDIYIEDEDNAFADRVVELFNDPQRRKQLGIEARKLAENKYAWASIGQVLLDAYQQVIEQPDGKS